MLNVQRAFRSYIESMHLSDNYPHIAIQFD